MAMKLIIIPFVSSFIYAVFDVKIKDGRQKRKVKWRQLPSKKCKCILRQMPLKNIFPCLPVGGLSGDCHHVEYNLVVVFGRVVLVEIELPAEGFVVAQLAREEHVAGRVHQVHRRLK